MLLLRIASLGSRAAFDMRESIVASRTLAACALVPLLRHIAGRNQSLVPEATPTAAADSMRLCCCSRLSFVSCAA
jgi:hypothetical protein